MSDAIERVLNPGIIVVMVAAGLAYSGLLWRFDIRGTFRTWAVATFSGGIFLAIMWAARAAQGVPATFYLALIVDWIVFSNVGFHAVMVRRWWMRRRAS